MVTTDSTFPAEALPTAGLSGACDCHLHLYDPAALAHSPVPEDATTQAYAAVAARLGLRRAVLIQPRNYGTDNSVLLKAIAALGPKDTRGVAVIHPDTEEDALRRMHRAGVRGVRFSLYTPRNAVVGFDMLGAVAARVAPLGWHLQLHWTAEQIVEHREELSRLPTPIVFDHMARIPADEGSDHPAFAFVGELLSAGRAWVKLSGPYLNSALGPARDYEDVDPLARAWIAAAPDRMVWGSDWPHVTEQAQPPDDNALLAMLSRWTDDAEKRRRILVDNPATLYGFDPI